MLRALMLGHAVLDWLSGILLMIWPGVVAALTPDGFVWSHYGYRTFGAALLAVGTASYLASKYTDRERLRDVMLWKSVWAGSVILGMLLTLSIVRHRRDHAADVRLAAATVARGPDDYPADLHAGLCAVVQLLHDTAEQWLRTYVRGFVFLL